jgi:hypothetical protein
MRRDVIEIEFAFPLRGAAAAEGEEAAEAAVGGAVGGEENDRRCVQGEDLGPDDQLEPRLLRRDMHPHGAGEGVAVGHRNRAIAQFRCPGDEFIGMRRPLQEGEVRLAVQFGIGDAGRATGDVDRRRLASLLRLVGHG